jgi:hypothetical protein
MAMDLNGSGKTYAKEITGDALPGSHSHLLVKRRARLTFQG